MLSHLLSARRRHLATPKAARRAAQSVYVGDGIALCRVLDRFKMYVPVRDRSLAPHLLLDGVWEPWVTRAIAERLRPGMVVADIGANVGYFTLLMADGVGPSGHVHAFEPNEYLSELIERSAVVNGLSDRVTVHPLALAQVDGREMLLVIPGNFLGGAAIWEPQPHLVPDSSTILTHRMDSIAGVESVELVKIDAEGAESDIWDGMSALLQGNKLRTVFIEFTAAHYSDSREFLSRLLQPGFNLSIIDISRGVVPITPDAVLALPAHIGPMLVLSR